MKLGEALSVDECKRIESEILRYIKKVCDENDIKYYLAYGTLLGAIRHSGFIPWDDDIDIFMPYEDYLRFIDIESKKTCNRYKLVSSDTNKSFTAPLAKVYDTHTLLEQNYDLIEKVPIGLYVDVFVLNGIGNDSDQAKNESIVISKLLRKWIMSDSKWLKRNSIIRTIISCIHLAPYKFMGYQHYIKKITKFRELHPYYSNVYVTQTSLTSRISVERNVWKQELFGEGIDVEFEGCKYSAPSNYHELLSILYGDYMKLPPKEKQITVHNYNAWMIINDKEND